jgi:hypothetical protein
MFIYIYLFIYFYKKYIFPFFFLTQEDDMIILDIWQEKGKDKKNYKKRVE